MSHPGGRYSTWIRLSWVQECTPVILEFKRQRQGDHCQSEASVIYIKSRPVKDTQHNSASKTKQNRKPKDFLLKYLVVRNAVRSFEEKKSVSGALKNTGAVALYAKFKGHRGKYIAFLCFADPCLSKPGAH